MQVILLEKVANLGNLGDVVKVKDGYARNFLIPTRQARRATESAIKEFEAKRAELEKIAAEKLSAAQALGEKINGNTVTISQKAGVDGRLFGSVTNADIAEALTKAGTAIVKSQVRLPNGPLKTVGEFPDQRRSAHRRGGGSDREGRRRSRVIARHTRWALRAPFGHAPTCEGRLVQQRSGQNKRKPTAAKPSAFCFSGVELSRSLHKLSKAHPQACPQCPRSSPRPGQVPATAKSRDCACRPTRWKPSRACSAAC